ncbi:NUDIX hydrolase [Marinobacter sp. X15-166B]|uniref:NUDIX hydrolase n=1 Tax=Marinobacter sp. X15-166B TaxID=1897620 RepID=UPI00085CD0E5|nr:NUDIX hydrolase [Marinobacter sp. X15-166B]OEY67669.1 ADP-ribose pyrophosphatase [Marinobacter sp. X15-166B]
MVVTLDFICLRLNPDNGQPEVMLKERLKGPHEGQYALVGGWVREHPLDDGNGYDHTLEDAVTRILTSKVGFLPSYLEKLPPEGSATRDPALGWSVTIPFLCLFNRPDMAELDQQDSIRWESIDGILTGASPLPFDHRKLVRLAYDAFLNKIKYSSLLLYLLPEKVAVSQIVHAYEIFGICVKKQTVFSRWINPGVLVETGERRAIAAKGQPSRLYRLEESSLSYFDSEIGKSYRMKACNG